MEGRVICAFSYRLLERRSGREQRREDRGRGRVGWGLIKMATGEGGRSYGEDERWMVDTKLS